MSGRRRFATRVFGGGLRPVIDALRADVVFGWRQLRKNKASSAAAILSLGLAIGASTSAFRLIDALLLRPLPVSHPERLYELARDRFASDGTLTSYDGWEYRLFREMRPVVHGSAELIAASFVNGGDVTYGSDREMEKAHLQYVSGWMFASFGLSPAAGRLFTAEDDLEPGAMPVAVISYDYWSRRFGRDRRVVGRTFRLGSNQGRASLNTVYEIIGVGPEKFSGTEPGTATDIFLPTTMNGWVNLPIAAFLRTYVLLGPETKPEAVYSRLRGAYRHLEEDERRNSTGTGGAGNRWTALYHRLLMEPAAAGVSGMQKQYRLPLVVVGALVGLVLLIACANAANLMAAQASARTREMAVRAATGASRWRLVQLVLVESAIMAALSTAAGALFAGWSAPFITGRINPPDNPLRLSLAMDWRVLAFGLAMALIVALLSGLAPALRASVAEPAGALIRGESPRSRQRLMRTLITAQAAFCSAVLLIAGLLVTTSARLGDQALGFSPERLLAINAVSQHAPASAWEQAAEHLRQIPGVERVALAEWALMDGWGYKYSSVVTSGASRPSEVGSGFLSVSPGWLETMSIPLLAGRDFRPSDIFVSASRSGAAIVNQAFARQYFQGENPVGRTFETTTGGLRGDRFEIVGLAGDAHYLDMRRQNEPVVYNAFRWKDGAEWSRVPGQATFIVKTSGTNPLALASVLRRELARARPDFYISSIRTQEELVRMHTERERLLATLGLFFAGAALLLAGLGIYGVLAYSVFQQRRDIAIRMALGARSGAIARGTVAGLFAMIGLGGTVGIALGLASARYIESLLYNVKASDAGMLAIPALGIMTAAASAAMPALIRALDIDPAQVLRAE